MRALRALSWIGLYFSSTWAVLINRTIDDTLPDSTGASITYLPDGGWNDGTDCEGCTAKPDSSQMSSGTWHDSTFNPQSGSNDFPNQVLNASVVFNGTSVYVFCALARTKTSPSGDSDMSFYIDGQLTGTFVKQAPGTDGYDYNVPVYVNESLSPGFHKLVLQNGHADGFKSLVILDKIIYSFDNGVETDSSATASPTGGQPSQNSSSSSNNIGAIVGPVVAVSVVALLLGVGICFLMRRRRLKNTTRELLDPLPTPNTESAWATQQQAIATPYPITQNRAPNSYSDANRSSEYNSTTSPTTYTSPYSESESAYSTPSYGYGSRARYQNMPQIRPLPSEPTFSAANAPGPQVSVGSPPPAYDLTDAANAPTFGMKH